MQKRPTIIVPLDMPDFNPPLKSVLVDKTLPLASPVEFFTPRPRDVFYLNHGATAPPYPTFYPPTPDGRRDQVK